MQLINTTGISDTTRFVTGLTGTIGFGFLPYFLSSTLETLPVLFMSLSSLSSVLSIITLFWCIFLKTLQDKPFVLNLLMIFVWGPLILFITHEVVSYIVKLEVPFPFSLGVFFIWSFSTFFMICASLVLLVNLTPVPVKCNARYHIPGDKGNVLS